MLAEARARFPAVTFWQGDVLDLPNELGKFDAIFFNACFGNLFDQKATLDSTSKRLNPGGRIVISHPLGNAFVAKLNAMDAKLVLSLLPSKEQLQQWSNQMNLMVSEFIDEHEYYLAIVQTK
jgi:riboflavin kinase